MDLKILAVLLVYWVFWIGICASAGQYLLVNTNAELNSTTLTSEEVDRGGLFNTGVSFGRWFAFVAFGLTFGADLPGWLATILFLIQTSVTVFTGGFVISAIWNG